MAQRRRRGLLVEGSGPGATFRIWLVPEDWVGIREVDPRRARETYWEGILLGRGHKSITIGPRVIQEALQKLDMRTPSLVNSGWHEAERIWKGREAEADRKATALVARHAADAAALGEAAHSLIVLGVPARSVLVRAAAEARGEGREYVMSALGYFSGPDVTSALAGAVVDPSCTGACQKYAAMALEQLGDPAAGPALAKALPGATHDEAATRIALALARVKHAAAGPAILARMEKDPSPHNKALFAEALAALRYQPAIPAIETLAKRPTFDADWALGVRSTTVAERDAGVSLLRLTGPWGAPVAGVRLLLLPPKHPGHDLAILIENQSGAMIMVPELLAGTLVIDGVAHPRGPMGWDGHASLHVGGVWIHPLRLSDFGAAAGSSIHYEAGALRSNAIAL